MGRVINFSAGPSALPRPVMAKAQAEFIDYEGSGMSVMEMSHRSKIYEGIVTAAEALLREIMDIPANYKVLFLQGGATQQFAMVPINLTINGEADYVNTGEWASKAIKEAKKFTKPNVVASSEDKQFTYIPTLDPATFNPNADFFHYTMNNTIYGTRFTSIPETGNVPLVCDMSSCILSEVVDVTKFGLIYAGAQKNIGPAGVTVVIVREDLLGHAPANTATMMDYAPHAKAGSMHNTPPTYGIYLAKLVFEWVKEMGGVAAIQKINEAKAKLLYDYVDSSKMFRGTVNPADRSMMNVTLLCQTPELDAKFVKEAEARGMMNLKGYRTVGGIRVSMYNACTLEDVTELVNFMKEFEAANI